jgi:Fe-S cluster biogenesis protein NfuA
VILQVEGLPSACKVAAITLRHQIKQPLPNALHRLL